ncbi:hypothetical protein G6F56_014284 [Rhizopus delemar]|nr:hypothetical protein G6F56_014284 [Rhizopus delemar]
MPTLVGIGPVPTKVGTHQRAPTPAGTGPRSRSPASPPAPPGPATLPGCVAAGRSGNGGPGAGGTCPSAAECLPRGAGHGPAGTPPAPPAVRCHR